MVPSSTLTLQVASNAQLNSVTVFRAHRLAALFVRETTLSWEVPAI